MKTDYRFYTFTPNRYTEAFQILVRNECSFVRDDDSFRIRLDLISMPDAVLKKIRFLAEQSDVMGDITQ
jgi:hypothetical protein